MLAELVGLIGLIVLVRPSWMRPSNQAACHREMGVPRFSFVSILDFILQAFYFFKIFFGKLAPGSDREPPKATHDRSLLDSPL